MTPVFWRRRDDRDDERESDVYVGIGAQTTVVVKEAVAGRVHFWWLSILASPLLPSLSRPARRSSPLSPCPPPLVTGESSAATLLSAHLTKSARVRRLSINTVNPYHVPRLSGRPCRWQQLSVYMHHRGRSKTMWRSSITRRQVPCSPEAQVGPAVRCCAYSVVFTVKRRQWV